MTIYENLLSGDIKILFIIWLLTILYLIDRNFCFRILASSLIYIVMKIFFTAQMTFRLSNYIWWRWYDWMCIFKFL